MASLFDYAQSKSGVPMAWSVSDLTRYIREMFDMDYRLKDVEIEGEVSNFTRARSGHLYFTLKDSEAQLKSVMWRSSAEKLNFQPQNGDQVIARGRVSVYEAGGAYQLYADRLQPAGRGNLAEAFERLKLQLAEEGLFAPEHKQQIPPLPSKIGIVTSADAAALRDILNVLRRRYPLVEVLIAPTLVQGNSAPAQIVRALQWLDGREDIDTIIVSRGGGSMEDLWAFNDEGVARAIFAAQHPIISGVGHEVDFTIADFVADLRAPTPSAAAELAVPDSAELLAGVRGLQQLMHNSMVEKLDQLNYHAQSLTRILHTLTPERQLRNSEQRFDELLRRLDESLLRQLSNRQSQLAVLSAQLRAVSPQATLERGYAIVRKADKIIHKTVDVKRGDSLNVQVSDGEFTVIAD